MQVTHGRSLIHDARVVVVHAVNVCPNLYLGSIDGSANQRSGVVASTPLQVINLTVCVAADEALRDVDVSIRMQLQLDLQLLLDIYRVRFGILVCPHEFQSWQQHGVHPALLQVEVHHAGGNQFALGKDDLFLEKRKQVLGIGTDIIEVGTNQFQSLLLILRRGIQLVDMATVFTLQAIDDFVGSFRILLVQIIRNLHQCVRCPRHGGQHHNLAFAIGNQFGHFLHPLGGTDRSTSKL